MVIIIVLQITYQFIKAIEDDMAQHVYVYTIAIIYRISHNV